jgi:heterodisulfide reductase subunit C
MNSKQPLWLQAVHRLERAVGKPVEAAVRTDTYFDLVTTTTRATGKAKRTAVGTSTRMLHLLNLPAATTCGACASSCPGWSGVSTS